jgi:hypothetical protein
MLAPLGFYLLNILLTCTAILVMSWAYDNHRATIEARPARPAEFEVDFDRFLREGRADFESVNDLLRVEQRHAA